MCIVIQISLLSCNTLEACREFASGYVVGRQRSNAEVSVWMAVAHLHPVGVAVEVLQ